MIKISSTDEERYQELKDKSLTVVPWDESKALQMTDPDESIAHAVRRFAREIGIIGTTVKLEGIDENVIINASTIKESISSMVKQHADLINLSKLFTVFKDVTETAILLSVEPFRHGNKPQKAKDVIADYQYISAFCDSNVIYPVKITAEKRKTKADTNVHVTVTIGTIPMNLVNKIEKEEHSIPRMHPSCFDGESWDSGRYSSFDISLPHFVENFNENQAILIKNFPDQMLNEKQLEIKQRLVKFDKEKDNAKQMALYTEIMTDAVNRGENFAFKIVPYGYEEKMRQAMFDSGICFIEFPSEANGKIYKTIAVQEKDADAFLKVQENVFKKQDVQNKNIRIPDRNTNRKFNNDFENDSEEDLDERGL